MNDELIHDILTEIHEDNNFTKEFKDFSRESFIVLKLCGMFEEGTGKKITKESINDETGILNFIFDTIPILKGIDVPISLNRELIMSLILNMYIPMNETLTNKN